MDALDSARFMRTLSVNSRSKDVGSKPVSFEHGEDSFQKALIPELHRGKVYRHRTYRQSAIQAGPGLLTCFPETPQAGSVIPIATPYLCKEHPEGEKGKVSVLVHFSEGK
jgi:hypothetical protein